MSTSDPLWEEASSEVIHIAEGLIERHHPYLKMANIGFIFRREAQEARGRSVLAHVEKVNERMNVFIDWHFVIWISKEDYERMNSASRKALIDHELAHIRLGENGLTIVGHDFEEFYEIIERHGFWDQRLQRIDRALVDHQMSLGLKIEGEINQLFGHVGKVSTGQAGKLGEVNNGHN